MWASESEVHGVGSVWVWGSDFGLGFGLSASKRWARGDPPETLWAIGGC